MRCPEPESKTVEKEVPPTRIRPKNTDFSTVYFPEDREGTRWRIRGMVATYTLSNSELEWIVYFFLTFF